MNITGSECGEAQLLGSSQQKVKRNGKGDPRNLSLQSLERPPLRFHTEATWSYVRTTYRHTFETPLRHTFVIIFKEIYDKCEKKAARQLGGKAALLGITTVDTRVLAAQRCLHSVTAPGSNVPLCVSS